MPVGLALPQLARPRIGGLGPVSVGAASHRWDQQLPWRIYYLNIEPIMSQNQYYKPIQSEVQV